MKRTLTGVLLLWIGLTAVVPGLAQQIEVTVDRTELARGETLTYTIRVFDQRQSIQLDLTPLTEDFDVLGTRTSSQIRSINGSVEAWTDYIITLFPLTEGELEIPSLTINNVSIEPIAIVVDNQRPPPNQIGEELFLELEVSKESVYVQEQLLLTMRLFFTISGIRNARFPELEMPDTVIRLIGSPNQYEKLIDGVRHGVYEKRYALFPQRSGSLEIPDILFRGEVTDGSGNYVFRNLNTRRVTAFAEGLTVDVKERPVAVQDSVWWLPATRLDLQQYFDRDLQDLQVGDSVVRTLTLRAEGLDGAVLPPFGDEPVNAAKVYPDPAEIEGQFVNGSIVGTRVEQSTIVATEAGTIEIPRLEIPWWNVTTDQPETAVVPATRIAIAAVAGAVPAEQMMTGTGNVEPLPSTPPPDQDLIDRQAQAGWMAMDDVRSILLLGLAVLIAAFGLYRLPLRSGLPAARRLLTAGYERVARHYHPVSNETIAFRQLQRACHSGQPAAIRQSLILWCNHFLATGVLSMEDLLQQRQAAELHPFVRAIQAQLFDGNPSARQALDSQALLHTVSRLRQEQAAARKVRVRQQRYALPPLYRI